MTERLRMAYQFHPTIAYGDAVGNDCFEIQRLFWTCGVGSELFADEAKPEVRPFVRDWRDLRHERTAESALLVHISMGNDSLDEVRTLPQRKVVVYHNITPARFFHGVNEHAERYAEIGRRQLAELASVSELGIADSEYNRRELEELGYARTAVVPIVVDWSAFAAEPDEAVLRDLAGERTEILVVGQILPQKGIHDVVAGFARYREDDRTARLHLVGSTAMSAGYLDRLRDQVDDLGLGEAVRFTGSVPASELAAYYRGATALLTLSDHEGFCVPLLEAMRSDLPIVAHAAGAIPETLGDAGVLLPRKSPDDVAAALERVVRDATLQRGLIERGRERLAAFAPEQALRRLREALALAGWNVPAPLARRLVVVSSDRRCGVHDYSRVVVSGLRANGHQVTFVGVRHLHTPDLDRKVRHIAKDTEAVIVEHEAGIFRDVPFVLALLRLWLRRIPTVLSLHELEPEKFHHYRQLTRALHYRPRYRWFLEVLRAPWVALRIASWFLRYRAVLGLMGGLPRRLVVHSHRSNHYLDLLAHDETKRDHFPLSVMPLEDAEIPRDGQEKRALRRRLGLPEDAFIFISPGFFFRRKRYVEVIEALPDDAVLVLSGTRSEREPEYFDEVLRAAEGKPNVIVNDDFTSMGAHVVASDCVVLFYEDVFQSAVATQAVWAGLPCIYSSSPGFRIFHGAGLVARDVVELRSQMERVRDPEAYATLRHRVAILRRLLAPERNAPRYLIDLT